MNKKLATTLAIIYFSLALFLFIYGFYGFSKAANEEPTVEEVPCYDRHNNEIKDLVCEQETFGGIEYLFLSIPTAMLLLIGMSFVNVSDPERRTPKQGSKQ